MKPTDDGFPDFDRFLDKSGDSVKESIESKFGIDIMRLIAMEADIVSVVKKMDKKDRGELHKAVKEVLLDYNINEMSILIIMLMGSKYVNYLGTKSLHLASEFSRIPVIRALHRKESQ